MGNSGVARLSNGKPRAQRDPKLVVRVSRWSPTKRFIAWVKAYKISALAQHIQVERKTIYSWLRGECPPHPDNANAIILASRGRPERAGRIEKIDIYPDPGDP